MEAVFVSSMDGQGEEGLKGTVLVETRSGGCHRPVTTRAFSSRGRMLSGVIASRNSGIGAMSNTGIPFVGFRGTERTEDVIGLSLPLDRGRPLPVPVLVLKLGSPKS